MSLLVFNSPQTIAWNSTKTMIWNTKVQKSRSGIRKTLSRWSYPEFNINCSYTCLDTDEIDYVAGFFGRVRGQFQPFLWLDMEDYKQEKVQIGIANGTTTGYQLVRNYKNLLVMPVRDIVPGTLQLYLNGEPIAHTSENEGYVEFATPPESGIVSASFEYYWRVAFDDDDMTWNNFWYNFYQLKQVKLVTVK